MYFVIIIVILYVMLDLNYIFEDVIIKSNVHMKLQCSWISQFWLMVAQIKEINKTTKYVC